MLKKVEKSRFLAKNRAARAIYNRYFFSKKKKTSIFSHNRHFFQKKVKN